MLQHLKSHNQCIYCMGKHHIPIIILSKLLLTLYEIHFIKIVRKSGGYFDHVLCS